METQNLRTAIDYFTFRNGITELDNWEYATIFVMLELWNGLQGSDRKDKRALHVTKFCNRTSGDKDVADLFSRLQDISYPKSAK